MKSLQEIKDTPKIYIAGKLNAEASDYIQNCYNMLEYAEIIEGFGCFVHIPCLDVLYGIKHGQRTYEDYVESNLKSLLECDAMFVCPDSENSKGVALERRICEKEDKPVFDDLRSVQEYINIDLYGPNKKGKIARIGSVT
jgi:hypothetical protein